MDGLCKKRVSAGMTADKGKGKKSNRYVLPLKWDKRRHVMRI